MHRLLPAIALAAGFVSAGCASSPPPPRVPVPPPGEGPVVRHPAPRPLPPDAFEGPLGPAPGPADITIVDQQLPQEPGYVAAYDAVGRPTVAVYVNRSFDGRVIPAELPEWRRTERRVGGAVIRPRVTRRGGYYYGGDDFEYDVVGGWDALEPIDQADRRPETDIHVRDRDELGATALDLAAVELILADSLSADGAVRLQSPSATRSRLSNAARQRLESGDLTALGEVVERLDADVLIHAAARPTLQTREGPQYRLLAEAIDTRSGASLGRAIVDVPPPLDKPTMNLYTAYIAAKLMDDLSGSWSVMAGEPVPNVPQTNELRVTPQENAQ